MLQKVAIGIQSFREIREKNTFYVDKTDFIREWWEKEDAVTLITRPRRFGKTLNMSMIECFFSLKYKNRADLFEGLSIWQKKDYHNQQGKWPVIALTFAAIKETSFAATLMKINQLIVSLYNQNYFLLKEGLLTQNEQKFFQSVTADMDEVTASLALHHLSGYLSRYYGKNVIFLLDEYDTPMQEAYTYGYWDEMVCFIRSMFNETFKTNLYAERVLMTGITRITKESIFSDFNNVKMVTTTSIPYMTAFGFTKEEVFAVLKERGLAHQIEKVKEWYDGFTFGVTSDIYNPWSITNYLDEQCFKAYWANTSSNSLVSKLIREGDRQVKMAMENLLQGIALETQIDEQIVFNQLGKNRSAIWSMLLASGYLKVEDCWQLENGKFCYRLSLTNKEVVLMFESLIEDWFGEAEGDYNDFITSLLHGEVKAMNLYMNKIALATFSYFDTGNKPSKASEPERFYHGFVLGMLVELKDEYHILSNRESGFGRYDVVLEPLKPNLDAIILEFKVRDLEEEKSLKETVEVALEQIEKMCYDASLCAKGIGKERIRHYGFAFEGKKVLIG